MASRSIPAKIFGQLTSKLTGAMTTRAVNGALSAIGLRNKTPKKLMPHELQALLEEHESEFSLNTFSGRTFWRDKMTTDIVLTELKNELSASHNLRLAKGELREAVQLACFSNPFSPVERYLHSLEWDGVDRVPALLGLMKPIYVDGAHEALTQKMIKCFLIGAAARGLEPGVKFDNVVIIRGKQRTGKSSLVRELASPQWFRDSMFDVETRDGLQNLQGVWLYELAELRATLKKNQDAVKLFLSSQSDTYRAPWQKAPETHPRAVVFVGTTNRDKGFLTDTTGSARFWVIDTGDNEIDVGGLAAIRDQVWAQAVSLRERGEKHWLDATDTELSEKLNVRFTV